MKKLDRNQFWKAKEKLQERGLVIVHGIDEALQTVALQRNATERNGTQRGVA